MSKDLWRRVAEKLDEHDYMNGIDRTVARVGATGEIFTPTGLVVEILKNVSLDTIQPGKSVLDPACGDGQFLIAAKWIKVFHFRASEQGALADIYGVDIMRDNVDLCRMRLGGGTILQGNSLDPHRRVPGQTEVEFQLMRELFDAPVKSLRKKPRLVKSP